MKTGESREKTPWAVHCLGLEDTGFGRSGPCSKDLIYLTHEEYMAQMRMPDARWACPRCGGLADWDDANYEEMTMPPEEE